MLFSRDWLSEYVELPPAPAVALALTEVGLAVEGQESRGADTIFDVDVTTNRTDAMNHFGIARELATKLGRPLRVPQPGLRESESAPRAADAVRIEIEPGCGALRYTVRVVRGVRVGPSPSWLRERLESIGQRPINNVVDVTNFVLWEMGQPLHAFDLERLEGDQDRTAGSLPRVVVRRARAGEKLVTLDRAERALGPAMLVIADARNPIGLAGVMGGLDSEVTEATSTVLIESAHFERARVRATARALGMKTDASHRFERGADPEACSAAADRAAALIAELGSGEVLRGLVDVRSDWPAQWPPRGVLSHPRLNAFAGTEYSAAEIEAILGGLGFGVERADAERWRLTVPSWRWYDIAPRDPQAPGAPAVEEADLFEEVIRLGGFDRIPAALPALPGRDQGSSPAHERRARVRAALAGAGYAEAIHYAFHSREADAAIATLVADGVPLALANPLSDLYSVMRRSLLPNLIATARSAQRRAEAVRLFEVGHLFPSGGAEVEAVALIAGGRLAGGLTGAPGEDRWQERQRQLDLRDIQAAVEDVLAALGVEAAFQAAPIHGLDLREGAEILLAGKRIGSWGRLAGKAIPYPLYVAELVLEELPIRPPLVAVTLPSRYPEVAADFTLTHPARLRWAELSRAIEEHAVPDLASFELRGQYRGPGVPEGAVNTTIRFHYQAEDRSLTQEEVNERHRALATDLQRRFGLEEKSAP